MTSLKAKPEALVKELARKKSNKNCFDCDRSGPQQNVNSTIGTFVCTQCAGLHRKYNHKVKTINMSTFTQAEVDTLEAQGNKRARKLWLHSFEPLKSYVLDPEDPTNIDKFMQLTYVDRKWAKPAGGAAADDDDDKKDKKAAKKAAAARKESVSDRAFSEATFPASITVTSATQPAAAAPAPKSSATDLGIDFLSALTVSAPVAQPHQQHQQQQSFGGVDSFTSISHASSNGASLFDEPAHSPSADAGSAAVDSLVDFFKRLQTSNQASPAAVAQWVQRALAQYQASASSAASGGLVAHTSPASSQSPPSHTQHQPAKSLSAPLDAFADLDIPGDEEDTGNPFDSSDDEDDTPNGHASTSHSGFQASPISPQIPQPQVSPQLAFQQQQFAAQQQAQLAYQQQLYQQQMMAQQQAQMQQHQGNFGQQQPNLYAQQLAYQQQQQQQHMAQQHQQQQIPQFQVQAAPQAAPQQPAQPPKPDLFAGFGDIPSSF